MKDRIKFTIYGKHPLLLLVRDYLILQGFVLQPNEDYPVDFILVGGHAERFSKTLLEHPVLLLSDSGLYSDRGVDGNVREKGKMSENAPALFIEPQAAYAAPFTRALVAENLFVNREAPTVIVRPFNVYGPHIDFGVIPKFLEMARVGQTLPIYGSGYQLRTFLHEKDFLEAIDSLSKKLVSGRFGIYNVGSDEEVSINRLADSVWQLVNPALPPLTDHVRADRLRMQWKIPDLQRVQAATKWKPLTSLRRGLWSLIHEEKEELL